MSRTRMFLVLLIATAGLAGGCEKPLFPEAQPRSPFERYLTLRGQQRPTVEEDATGRERPALRQRLRPLDQP